MQDVVFVCQHFEKFSEILHLSSCVVLYPDKMCCIIALFSNLFLQQLYTWWMAISFVD